MLGCNQVDRFKINMPSLTPVQTEEIDAVLRTTLGDGDRATTLAIPKRKGVRVDQIISNVTIDEPKDAEVNNEAIAAIASQEAEVNHCGRQARRGLPAYQCTARLQSFPLSLLTE